MKNQSLYELFAISFPTSPREKLSDGREIYAIEDVDVIMDARGIRDYRNEQSRGDAYRKSLLLGINALFFVDQPEHEQTYAAIAFNALHSFTVYVGPNRKVDDIESIATMRGNVAVSVRVTDISAQYIAEPDWIVVDNGTDFTPQ